MIIVVQSSKTLSACSFLLTAAMTLSLPSFGCVGGIGGLNLGLVWIRGGRGDRRRFVGTRQIEKSIARHCENGQWMVDVDEQAWKGKKKPGRGGVTQANAESMYQYRTSRLSLAAADEEVMMSAIGG